jgi:putative transposase
MLGVSPAGYYAWTERPICSHDHRDEVLAQRIEQIFRSSHGRYGAPRVHQALRQTGVLVARKRVARLMRQRSLRARTPRRRVQTTDGKHRQPVAENLLARQFSAASAHQKWTSDITYIATRDGWLYLTVVLDLFSRRVIGWSMSHQIDEALVGQALRMAIAGKPADRCVLPHSDRGSQYAAAGIRQLCSRNAVVQSMSCGAEHESSRQLLGQCARRELLRHIETGACR